MSEPRQDKDKNDIHKLLAFQEPRNPFGVDPTLRSIVTGIEANGFGNVDQTQQVADKILCDMVDKPVTKYTFRKQISSIPLVARVQSGFKKKWSTYM